MNYLTAPMPDLPMIDLRHDDQRDHWVIVVEVGDGRMNQAVLPEALVDRLAARVAGTDLERALEDAAAEVREVNQANGWFDSDRRPAEGLALIHSEVSEWLEALRDGGTEDMTFPGDRCPNCGEREAPHHVEGGLEALGVAPHLPKPQGAGSEAADVLIRLLDECVRQGIDLPAEYRRKIAYNRTRTYRHGGRSL